jgi:hypothetical protein
MGERGERERDWRGEEGLGKGSRSTVCVHVPGAVGAYFNVCRVGVGAVERMLAHDPEVVTVCMAERVRLD